MIAAYSTSILWRTFGKYRKHLVALIALGFLGAVFEGIGINVAIPLLSFFMGGGATTTNLVSNAVAWLFGLFHIPFTFRYLLAFIVGLFLLRAVSLVAFGYIRGWITADFLSSENKELLRLTLHASWPFLLKQKIGHMHSTLVRDMQRTSSLLEALSQCIQSWTGFFMYLLIAVNISPLMTFATMVGGGVLFFLVRPLFRKTQAAGEEMSLTEKKISQFLSEHIIGMKSLKAAGAEDKAYATGKRLMEHIHSLYVRLAFVRGVSTSLFQPFSLMFVIVLFAISYNSGQFSIISFAAELYLVQKIFTYLESGQVAIHSVGELIPYAKQVQEFKRLLSEAKEEREQGTLSFAFLQSVVFDHVSLEYIENEPVLHDVSFEIKKGTTVALIGPSGAGKTTVADLLLRLFEPNSGKILLDGEPLSRVRLEDWRTNLGYVSQDVFLLNDTIEENIRFYSGGLSKEEIELAAKQANIHDFVMSQTEAYKTIVGDRGVMLSGGQRQRIALARALARKPKLLILDEATSALDAESEKLIQEAIDNLQGQVTVLIIAHRLSTIEHADKIIVLEKGRVAEEGTPKELENKKNSYFYRVKHHNDAAH